MDPKKEKKKNRLKELKEMDPIAQLTPYEQSILMA